MRTLFLAEMVAASLVIVAGAPCLAQTVQTDASPPSGQLQTPHDEGTRNVGTAAAAPLHDLNLVRQNVPPVLLAAMADPYARVWPMTCQTLEAEVNTLSEVLGADFDVDVAPQERGLTQSGGVGLSLVHGAAANLLPFDGFVRTLSGAERHDQFVLRAINAGSARRAYLKGLGEAGRCPPPARPHHLVYAAPPVEDRSMKPLYPVR